MSADTVTLSFGGTRPRMIATMNRRDYENIKRDLDSGTYRESHEVDQEGVRLWVGSLTVRDVHGEPAGTSAGTFRVTMRLAAKLGLPFDVSDERFKRFALDIGKFVRGVSAYDISGGLFSSLDDGTYWRYLDPPDGPGGHPPADPRMAKVKRFLRRHLRREPTDKDVDTFVYMYFGSDAFSDEFTTSHVTLFRGLQNSDYNRNGRHWRRSRNPDNDDNWNPPVRRRNQRRIVGQRFGSEARHYGRYRYGYGSGSNSNSNSNNRPTSAQYARNNSRVKMNKIKNKSYKNWIKWEEQTVNNLPSDPITLNTFSNGQKAVKIHPTANHYVSPQTFRSMARTSMTNAFNKNGNAVLFKSPMTRQNVRRSNIKFVILKNKNTGRATKAKKNAANKIGDARRRQLTRRSTLARAKAAAAALKRKRSQ